MENMSEQLFMTSDYLFIIACKNNDHNYKKYETNMKISILIITLISVDFFLNCPFFLFYIVVFLLLLLLLSSLLCVFIDTVVAGINLYYPLIIVVPMIVSCGCRFQLYYTTIVVALVVIVQMSFKLAIVVCNLFLLFFLLLVLALFCLIIFLHYFSIYDDFSKLFYNSCFP